jgi:UDP-N-acetylmuramyl tripeptide synthase
MQEIVGTILGKSVKKVAQLRRGSGQALPGLVIEKLFPAYFVKMLRQLPDGIVIIAGTNGKTTTTKIVTELLQANGKRVLTNPTGSNLTRGINSTLIHQAKLSGKLPFDIAILELDEAYAKQFAKLVKPRWVLTLNVTRDQLDRFGEVDTAATMLAETMAQATEGVVTNANDPRLSVTVNNLDVPRVVLFGVDDSLRKYYPSENELVAVGGVAAGSIANKDVAVVLTSFSKNHATYKIGDKELSTTLQLSGQHNYQNVAAAIALTQVLLPEIPAETLITQLAKIKSAFGRGELFQLKNDSSLQLILVKNPAGFRQALASYLPSKAPIMVAINDNIADSRDVSWLWDVDFSPLKNHRIALTSGKRAADMALRLQYEDIAVEKVEPNLSDALKEYCQLPGDKLLFTTYTAMLWFYKTLKNEAGKKL